MEKPLLYIVMPAYNEEANIEATIRQWHPIVENISRQSGRVCRMVIFNDGSKDNTGQKIAQLQSQFPCLDLVNKPNSGHGPTLIQAYHHALDQGAEWIFQTDSDGQTNPDEFASFWNKRDKYEAIFGIRLDRKDGTQRVFVEKVVCLLLKLFFQVDIPDANAPFRLMHAPSLKKYLDRLPADYNLPNIMLTTFYKRYNEPIAFEEISFAPRTAGKNSINLRKITKIGWTALGDFQNFRKDMARDRH